MRLKEARKNQGMTQTELAEEARTSQTVIQYLEAGKRFPTEAIRERIESVLGPINWAATRLQGEPVGTALRTDDAAEERIVAAIVKYVRSALVKERPGRLHFLRQFLDEFEKDL